MRRFAITPNVLRPGNTLLMVMVFTMVVLTFVTIIYSRTNQHVQVETRRVSEQAATRVAESGIEKAVWCLNNPSNTTDCPGNPNYTGEANIPFGHGAYTSTVTGSGNTRTINVVSTVNGTLGTVTRELSVTLTTSNTSASFQYGVQAGEGGITLDNNASILGNAYTNGSIVGSNGSSITGDAILAASNATLDQSSNPSVNPLTTVNFGTTGNQYLAQSFTSGVNETIYSIELKVATHGTAPPGTTLYIYSDNAGNPGTNLSGSGQAITAGVADDQVGGWENAWVTQIFTPNVVLLQNTKYWLVLKTASTSGTKYWLSVRSTADSAYAAGTAKIGNTVGSLTALNYDLAFKINVGGQYPTLNVPSVGGNGYSHIISSTTLGGKAYYQQLAGTVKANGGTTTCQENDNTDPCFDNSTDQPPQNFPLSPSQIAQMESQAALGGTTTCLPTCTITSGSTIGPRKYVGDVALDGTVYLSGTLWVKGNLTIINGAILQLASGYGANSGVVVVDDPDNPTTKGRITLSNNGNLRGTFAACTGTPLKCSSGSRSGQSCTTTNDCPNGNYIMAISMNADPTFVTSAIDVSNNLNAGVLYAPYGLVNISNNASLNEVTAQKIHLSNNCQISYQSGLASVVFTSGPGASWIYQSGSYQIIN